MSRKNKVETVTGSAPPEIAEQDASGAIAEFYADIRTITQRPVLLIGRGAWYGPHTNPACSTRRALLCPLRATRRPCPRPVRH